MGTLDSLKKWFQPVTDPLCGANKVADDLNTAHQDFMRGFASIMTGMMIKQISVPVNSSTTVATDMAGDGADAISTEALSYLQISVSVTPTPDLMLAGAPVQAAAGVGGATEVSALTEVGTLSAKAMADIEEALANAELQIGEDAALDTVTEVVDGAAVAEAGANPIADAAALILTIIAAALFLKTLYDMAWAIYDAIQTWQKATSNACKPLPTLPTVPKPVTPTQPTQPTQPTNPTQPGTPPNPTTPPSLSQADKDLAKELAAETGVAQNIIEDIISQNPGLTKEEYKLLIKYYQKYKKYPFNTLMVFSTSTPDGKEQIYYMTQGDLDHARHPDALDALSDEELLGLAEDLLENEEPGKTVENKNKGFVDYNYYDVEVDGYYVTVTVRVSTTNPGRIISIFERPNG
ncbi:hypothetical protein [Tengunoibacter tsumagoiensis]|uniref:Uncharacterized protein n=1 Tax=Tengunoibacter tsumagoiensis TaxID=2014871 RepID=A0A401ZV14_9CHLR|nr:hypothetical protein [Tengunoibacter tsumagoiensis]GCE10677.1 hypothetical protein KTT_05360 [Tengunoibacter tsumagoiensis]